MHRRLGTWVNLVDGQWAGKLLEMVVWFGLDRICAGLQVGRVGSGIFKRCFAIHSGLYSYRYITRQKYRIARWKSEPQAPRLINLAI